MDANRARIGIIGGSGLGQALLGEAGGTAVGVPTPFGRPSAEVVLAAWRGIGVAILARHGVGHAIPPSKINYRANIYALKAVGCRWILASGAVGSLREGIAPRDLVVADQVIDKTARRAATFYGGAAVHVELAEPFCPELRQMVLGAAGEVPGVKVHGKGTYVCMEGPAFSTRAESEMHRAWGGDLIGMTAMPEAKLAREAEMSYALVALATDYDCWRPHAAGVSKGALLAEIIGNLQAATGNALGLIKAALPRVWESRGRELASERALELAIWTDKAEVPAAERERLAVLWGRYFPQGETQR